MSGSFTDGAFALNDFFTISNAPTINPQGTFTPSGQVNSAYMRPGFFAPPRVAIPKGCNECRHTGYLGRSAIYEQMPITSALRKGIASSLDLPAFQQLALKDGMRPLRYAAAEIVARGITTVREVIEVLPPPE